MSNVIQLSDFVGRLPLTHPCTFCLCDVPRSEFDAHKRACREERSRRLHPSNHPPSA